mgnify:CR=1 FL=1
MLRLNYRIYKGESSELKVLLKLFVFIIPALLIVACGESSSSETSTGYESPAPPPVSNKLSQPAETTASNTAEGLSPATGTGTQVTIEKDDPARKTGEYVFSPDTFNFKQGSVWPGKRPTCIDLTALRIQDSASWQSL